MSDARVEVRIHGVVQGVGYRYYCTKLARRFDICGLVRNNYDGTVAMIAEGKKENLSAIIEQLKIGPPSAVVKKIDIEWREFRGEYDSFDVSH